MAGRGGSRTAYGRGRRGGGLALGEPRDHAVEAGCSGSLQRSHPLQRGPQGRRRPSVDQQECHVLPTLLDLLELPPPRQAQGRSLAAALRTGEALQSRDLFFESLLPEIRFQRPPLKATQFDRWKTILRPSGDHAFVSIETHAFRVSARFPVPSGFMT